VGPFEEKLPRLLEGGRRVGRWGEESVYRREDGVRSGGWG